MHTRLSNSINKCTFTSPPAFRTNKLENALSLSHTHTNAHTFFTHPQTHPYTNTRTCLQDEYQQQSNLFQKRFSPLLLSIVIAITYFMLTHIQTLLSLYEQNLKIAKYIFYLSSSFSTPTLSTHTITQPFNRSASPYEGLYIFFRFSVFFSVSLIFIKNTYTPRVELCTLVLTGLFGKPFPRSIVEQPRKQKAQITQFF